MTTPARPRVGLLVTCLVDLFRPEVGFASVKLIEDAGCIVEVPRDQTCCGQPAYNSGDKATAQELARNLIALFEGYDYVVAPSGSCAGMLKVHFPALLADDPLWENRARRLAARSFELVSFLHDVLRVTKVAAAHAGTVTYHDGCSGLRELGIKGQPRALLGAVEGLALKELSAAESCCGFGGLFCVKYPEISNRMVGDKVAAVIDTGAATLLAGDMGCVLNIAGKLSRLGAAVHCRHVAEVLAGMANGPAIGQSAPAAKAPRPARPGS